MLRLLEAIDPCACSRPTRVSAVVSSAFTQLFQSIAVRLSATANRQTKVFDIYTQIPWPGGVTTMKSDVQIKQDFLAELQRDPSVHVAWIDVQVRDGIMSLMGHVCSHAERMEAQQAVQRVAGVRAQVVELEVGLGEAGERRVEDIAAAAKDALAWATLVPKGRVTLTALNGVITLFGIVDAADQRAAALAAVHHLHGVITVDDQITLKPRVAVDAIQGDIEAALARRAHNDAQAISVSPLGSAIVLKGTVSPWADRELAMYAAWSGLGVYEVIDNMAMAS